MDVFQFLNLFEKCRRNFHPFKNMFSYLDTETPHIDIDLLSIEWTLGFHLQEYLIEVIPKSDSYSFSWKEINIYLVS